MPRCVLVTYAGAQDPVLNEQLLASQRQMLESINAGGIERTIAWDREKLIATAFYQQNMAILSLPRGGGYWLWKPFIILDALRSARGDEVVLYWDVGRAAANRFTRPVEPLVRWCLDHDGMLPGVPILKQANWSKRDCFHYMGCDAPKFWDARQIQATFSLWSGHKAVKFVSQWLHWCFDPRCLTDQPNECGLPNLPDFREHRHDQSILTNLCVRDGVRTLDLLPLRPGAWSKDLNLWSEALTGPEGATRVCQYVDKVGQELLLAKGRR